MSSTPDYFSISGSLTFTPGQTSKTLRLHIIEDTTAEPQESLSLQIGNGISLIAQSTITVVDNDTIVTAPRMSVGDITLDEKDGTATVPVTMGWPSGEASNSIVTVHYATSNSTATAGSDYTAASGTLTFARGENVKNIPITIADDTTAEPAERINITLSAPTGGATLQDPNGVIVITPNDATAIANPQIITRAVVVGEGDGFVDLVIGLSVPRTTPLTSCIKRSSTPHSPRSTPDYFDISGTLTFTPGQTSKTLRVQIINDATAEPQESLFLQIISGNILAAQSAITIVDNDNGRRVLNLGISNDLYSVTAASDIIVENPAGGTDRVQSPVTYTLPANVENLTLTGAGAINGTGNTAANQLVGNTAANTLNGLAGNDVLTGGAGADTVTGGTGADTIVLSSTTGSDTVTDFSTVDDTFRISMAGIPIGNGDTVVNGGVTRAAPGGFASAAELVIFTSNITGAITTTNAAAKIGSATSAYTAGANRLFVVDNGTETDIFRFRSSASNAIVSAAELTLVAKVHYTAPTTATALSDYTFGA